MCEHEYRVIHDNLEVKEERWADSKKIASISVSGYAVFHCAKCLDIKKKVIE